MGVFTHRLPSALSAALLCTVFLIANSAAAGTKAPVRINPFAQPLVAAPIAARFSATGAGSSGLTAGVSASPPLLQLRGVLQAGASSFANIDGKIVGLNETVFGMRLKSVSETAAVFVRDGEDVVLKLSSAPGSVEISSSGGTNLEDSN